MSLPGKYNMTVARGKTFLLGFQKKANGVAVNMAGWKARCQIRSPDGQFGPTTTTTLLLELLDGNGVAITDAMLGKVEFTLTAAQTVSLAPANERIRLVYEIEVYDDSGVTEVVDGLVAGYINILPETLR